MAFLGSVEGVGFWVGFLALILFLLAFDLFWLQRRPHAIAAKEAFGWVLFWVALAAAFNVFVYFRLGLPRALEFTTGYLVELALSVDNVFVFLVIFRYFQVPPRFQHRVLFFGILGAIIMRAIFILTGAALLARFQWVIYIFGAFLVCRSRATITRNGSSCAVRSGWRPLRFWRCWLSWKRPMSSSPSIRSRRSSG
jgi:tellurite resistance protein TerC